jgi:hypothetical protein
MSTDSGGDKLAELRARTDRQLIELIQRTLDRALRGDRGQMQKTYNEAVRLLPIVYRIGEADRSLIELKLREIEDALENESRPMRAYSAGG